MEEKTELTEQENNSGRVASYNFGGGSESKTKYREIEFDAGQNIESAVKELKEQKDLVCGSFNGQMLYSDIDDMDSAYKKITQNQNI